MFVLSYMYCTFWNFRHRLVRLYVISFLTSLFAWNWPYGKRKRWSWRVPFLRRKGYAPRCFALQRQNYISLSVIRAVLVSEKNRSLDGFVSWFQATNSFLRSCCVASSTRAHDASSADGGLLSEQWTSQFWFLFFFLGGRWGYIHFCMLKLGEFWTMCRLLIRHTGIF